MEKSALVIIDVQMAMFMEAVKPYRGDEVVANICTLLNKAREKCVPVVFVQHDDEEMPRGSAQWQLHTALVPQDGEYHAYKQTRDSFYQTELDSILKGLGVDTLVFCGLQTEYCVNATCSRAYTLGYRSYLASDAHTTFDSSVLPAEQIINHHNSFLRSGFLQVKTTQELLQLINQ